MAGAIGAQWSADADGLLGFFLTRVRPQEDKISVTANSIVIILSHCIAAGEPEGN
jgi:hypothetical protein